MSSKITREKMMTEILYRIWHTEWSWYKMVRLWNVLQLISDTDDSFQDIYDIEETKILLDLWWKYSYDLTSQSSECIEYIYNLCNRE